MARLPKPGGDDGSWGSILNDYLAQAHNSDGTLKSNSVTAAQLAPNAVTGTALNISSGTDGQILTLDSTKTSGFSWKTATGSVSDATTTAKGVVQLAGDLGGTAAAPTVPGLANKVNTSTIGQANGVASLDGSGKVLSSQLPASTNLVTSVAGRTGDIVLAEADIANLSIDLSAKVAKSTMTTKGDLLAATGSAVVGRVGVGTDGQVLTADSTKSPGLAWVTATSSIQSSSDVALSGLSGNDVLTYNSIDTKWENKQVLDGRFSFSSPADGDVAQFDSTSGKFINSPLDFSGVAGTTALAQMTPGGIFRILWDVTVNSGSGGWTYAGTYITARPTSRTDVFMEAVDITGGSGGTPPGFAVTGDTYEVKTS